MPNVLLTEEEKKMIRRNAPSIRINGRTHGCCNQRTDVIASYPLTKQILYKTPSWYNGAGIGMLGMLILFTGVGVIFAASQHPAGIGVGSACITLGLPAIVYRIYRAAVCRVKNEVKHKGFDALYSLLYAQAQQEKNDALAENRVFDVMSFVASIKLNGGKKVVSPVVLQVAPTFSVPVSSGQVNPLSAPPLQVMVNNGTTPQSPVVPSNQGENEKIELMPGIFATMENRL